jgi:hypothetical protein
MLVIRNAQLAVLGAPFVEKLVQFVREKVPEHYEREGEAGARALAMEAIERAKPYGIVRCRDIGRYLAFMVILGHGFDTDPRYPWASAILRAPDLSSEEKLAKLLTAAAAL